MIGDRPSILAMYDFLHRKKKERIENEELRRLTEELLHREADPTIIIEEML